MERMGNFSVLRQSLICESKEGKLMIKLESTIFGEGKIIGLKVLLDGDEVEGEIILDGQRRAIRDVSSERPIILKPGNKIIFILNADKRGKGELKLLLWSEITPNPYIAVIPIYAR